MAALPDNAGAGGDVTSEGKVILSGDVEKGDCGVFEENGSRKGFRDTGRGGGAEGVYEGECGDAIRLRKGLLEERLRVSPEGRESIK
jgi:hypothetical protein